MNTLYLVGLGNHGDKYKNTRHNAGYELVDYFVSHYELPQWHRSKISMGLVTDGVYSGKRVVALLPETFMNLSGQAVRGLYKEFPFEGGVKTDDLIVVHDDLALPFGTIKISRSRGDGGHNGVRSIMQNLGHKDFVRIRFGIEPRVQQTDEEFSARVYNLTNVPDFVLKPFTADELTKFKELKQVFAEILNVVLSDGVDVAMNRFN